ncbi:Ran-specific GTPase-activating protein 2 (Ran-binding protein 2) (RANBP2) [Durusdinium trenchii]|uniref:Ran-specific GTPase-activating protein 2 (Ran-binding protein 2) (RANBP2) n=1 Tax=Durusdinium trenchii TaxID=1381693 RepID=A0ABP0KTW6_9DINO
MKRPASELERVSQTEPELAGDAGDAGCESNPFAGISLFQSGASSLVSSTTGFPSNGTMTESGNPFMGLSLFSSPTSGKLFTAAVTTLQQKPPGDAGDQPKADCEAAEVAEAAEDAANEADDGESAGDEPTGEEDEEVIFRADCKLWKLVKLEDGKAEGWRWQERGCGIVHINRHKTSGAGRLVMRMRGVLKLLLNTPIFPTTRYEKVGQKSVRFVGVDTEESQSCHGEVAFCAFRLNLHSSDQQGKFLAVLREAVKA